MIGKITPHLLVFDSAAIVKYCREIFRCFFTLQLPFKQFGQGAKMSFASILRAEPTKRRASFEGPTNGGPKY